MIVYWSSQSETTHRFVEKLNIENIRLPINSTDTVVTVNKPFILILPTYGNTLDTAIPESVKDFLAVESNQNLMEGVIGAGNKDFGKYYCLAARAVNHIYFTNLLYQFELSGTASDVSNVLDIIKNELRD